MMRRVFLPIAILMGMLLGVQSGNPAKASFAKAMDTIWVDFDYAGTERGTETQPFSTLAAGVNAVNPGGTVMIEGRYPVPWTSETPTINKPIRIETVGGRIRIGGPPVSSFRGIGLPPGEEPSSAPYGVSDDGYVVVGWSWHDGVDEAFRWTETEGLVGLGDLAGAEFFSVAFGVSGDGSTIVGIGVSATAVQPTRWTTAEGMVGLGLLRHRATIT